MPTPQQNPVDVTDAALKAAIKAVQALADRYRALETMGEVEAFQLRAILSDGKKRLAAATAGLAETMQTVETRAITNAELSLDTYADRMKAYLIQLGFDVQGQPPHLAISGSVFVNFDRQKQMAYVNDLELPDLGLPSVGASVKTRLAVLTAGSTPAAVFVEQLSQAYDSEIAESGRSPAEQVRISELYSRLLWQRQSKAFRSSGRASAFREYTSEQFRADLYRVLAERVRTANARAIRVDSGADNVGAIWMLIPALERTGYVGRISFIKDDQASTSELS
jgi:hypothetical protein